MRNYSQSRIRAFQQAETREEIVQLFKELPFMLKNIIVRDIFASPRQDRFTESELVEIATFYIFSYSFMFNRLSIKYL